MTVSLRSNNKPSSGERLPLLMQGSASTLYNRFTLCLPLVMLFAFQFCPNYLFHSALQTLVLPQIVEQQGRCLAAFRKGPKTEGSRS